MKYKDAMEKYNSDKPDTGGFVWITDFPLFMAKEDGSIEAAHHPFTMPANEEDVYKNPIEVYAMWLMASLFITEILFISGFLRIVFFTGSWAKLRSSL